MTTDMSTWPTAEQREATDKRLYKEAKDKARFYEFQDKSLHYEVLCRGTEKLCDSLHVTMGWIKPTNDKRWAWNRNLKKGSYTGYRSHWTQGQGVASSLEEAKAKILEGWKD